jgi:hypothetical protein
VKALEYLAKLKVFVPFHNISLHYRDTEGCIECSIPLDSTYYNGPYLVEIDLYLVEINLYYKYIKY